MKKIWTKIIWNVYPSFLIVVIVNKITIVNIQTKPYHWHVRVLGIFDDINHIRVDNSQKVIYDKTFDNEIREIFKIKSYISSE